MDRVDFETNQYLDSQFWSREEEMAHSNEVIRRAAIIANDKILDIKSDGLTDKLYELSDEWSNAFEIHPVADVRQLNIDKLVAMAAAFNKLNLALFELLTESSMEQAEQELKNESD